MCEAADIDYALVSSLLDLIYLARLATQVSVPTNIQMF